MTRDVTRRRMTMAATFVTARLLHVLAFIPATQDVEKLKVMIIVKLVFVMIAH